MRKYLSTLIIYLILILALGTIVFANTENTISLSDNGITVNGEKISEDTSSSIYLSNQMNNGATSTDALDSNIEIDNILNINAAGTYEFTGTLNNGQISVNANNINGSVNIILNNANITCEDAPAIFVYSKDVENDNCKITITLKESSINTITGGRLKQSVQNWTDQNKVLYYIDKGNDDDGTYYERYKYDGAISSDVSLTFNGKGTLNLNSYKKEGIESKMNITIDEGNYNINTVDDGINACTDGKSKIEINGGTVLVKINLENAEEGDGIDSNGSLEINGGKVFTFAYPGSDNGLDADLGVYINGGTVLSIGSMFEEFKTSNNSKIIQMNLSQIVNEGDTIAVVDEEENIVFAYKTDRRLNTFVYSSEDLGEGEYTVYTGTEIDGTLDKNNVYTNISTFDLSQMTKQESSGNRGMNRPNMNESQTQDSILPKTQTGIIIFVVLIIILMFVIAIFVYDIFSNRKKEI